MFKQNLNYFYPVKKQHLNYFSYKSIKTNYQQKGTVRRYRN